MARLIEIDWPEFGPEAERPEFTVADLQSRMAALRAAMGNRGFTHAVVYADREHFANLTWLTQFDPRFEEALLIVKADGSPLLLTGNECMSYLPISPLWKSGLMRAERFQPFSLLDQPRDASRTLREIFLDEGIEECARVACIGWKYYGDPFAIDLPSYIVDTLRQLAGYTQVTDATDLLVRLRANCTAAEIAFFEYTNHKASNALRRMIFAIREGMTDQELITHAGYNGLPLSCHMTCKTGPNRVSLASASGARIERGYPWSANIAYWGSNICRAGWVAESESDLPAPASDYVDNFAGPYMDALAVWIDNLRPGTPGGQLHDLIQRRLPFDKYGIFLNAGHLIHFDEWLSSPVYANSSEPIRSGMVFQTDIIPSNPVYFSTRMEDGLAIADAPLRTELAARFPAAWQRIQARRAFASQTLGFPLHDEHLPLSNLFGLVAPFVLRPRLVFALP
jgi:Xaa-Pro aminopeptidase